MAETLATACGRVLREPLESPGRSTAGPGTGAELAPPRAGGHWSGRHQSAGSVFKVCTDDPGHPTAHAREARGAAVLPGSVRATDPAARGGADPLHRFLARPAALAARGGRLQLTRSRLRSDTRGWPARASAICSSV